MRWNILAYFSESAGIVKEGSDGVRLKISRYYVASAPGKGFYPKPSIN